MFDALVGDFVNLVHTEYHKETNKSKVDDITDKLFGVFYMKIRPYILLVAVILLLILFINISHFYYYIKVLKTYNAVNAVSNAVSNAVTVAKVLPPGMNMSISDIGIDIK